MYALGSHFLSEANYSERPMIAIGWLSILKKKKKKSVPQTKTVSEDWKCCARHIDHFNWHFKLKSSFTFIIL